MNDRVQREVLQLQGVIRTFRQAGAPPLEVLRGCDLALPRGSTVALVGPSGAGKSTLLQIAGLLEQPTAGQVVIDGQEAGSLDDGARTALRRRKLGFVYQFHHLLPEFSALENVALPAMIAGSSRSAAAEKAAKLLDRVGLAQRLEHRPARLSGGEQQRVAIARALVNGPAVLIADEPTGNLDEDTADVVFSLLKELAAESAVAALIATHNRELASRMDQIFELHQGLLKRVEDKG